MKYISIFYLFLSVTCNIPKETTNQKENNFYSYYYHIANLPRDSMVTTANGIIVPYYQQHLKFLDGYEIPTFRAQDLNGNIRVFDYKNKLTILNFWFIGCTPCVQEIPLLNKLQMEYKDELEIISICRDPKADLQEFMEENKIDYTQIPDGQSLIQNVFKMEWGYQKNILINKDGKVLTMWRGFLSTSDPNYTSFENLIVKYK